MNECQNYLNGNYLLLLFIVILLYYNWKGRKDKYNEGFKDGLDARKPNKKLDKLIKKGIEV